MFTPPKIISSVEEHSEIINWMDCELSSLPFLLEISDDEIKSLINSYSIPEWKITFKQIPVYMQAVERCVKLVTEAQGNIFGAEYRDEFMRMSLLSSSSMPYFSSQSFF